MTDLSYFVFFFFNLTYQIIIAVFKFLFLLHIAEGVLAADTWLSYSVVLFPAVWLAALTSNRDKYANHCACRTMSDS